VIDTHAHLDACDGDVAAVLARAREAGVTRVISVGTDIQSCRATLDICDREDGVYAALGIHPHHAANADDEDVAELWRLLVTHPKVVAIGETGLDFFRDYAPRDRQLELFRSQAMFANALGEEALVIHSRAADAETVEVLTTLEPEVDVVLHCFSSVGLLESALEYGWYVSFAGNLTYPKAADLRAAAARVSRDRLLVETDSPYLSPQPVRGKQNEPAHVVHTLVTLAEVRGEELSDLGHQIEANALEAFGLP
jgi:TatD DNase family protein